MRVSMLAFAATIFSAACFYSPTAKAETTNVFRAVQANNAGVARTNPGQFRFNPSLSTFDAAHLPPSPCYVVFLITGVQNNPPQQGDTGLVDDLKHGDAYYTATFNNNPPGHWDIELPDGVTDPEGRQDVSDYARANPEENIVNGTSNNCVPD